MATSTTAIAGATSGTTAPSVSVIYVTVQPLSETFTPPASCGEMRLTQLSSPGYQLWLNEPQPVTQSQFGDCYPPGFIDGYTSGIWFFEFHRSHVLSVGLSRRLDHGKDVDERLYSLLRLSNGGGSGFLLHPPDTTIDENRPAYGGTCYSNFETSQTVKVTAYDSAGVTATVDWVASGTTDQAYAHPIDGFQLAAVTAQNSASETQTPSPTSSAGASSSSSHLSGGAIAGAVIGSVAGLVLILLAVLFLARRYQRRKNQGPAYVDNGGEFPQQYQTEWNKEPDSASPSTGYIQSPYYAPTTGTFDSRSPAYNTGHPAPRYELGTQEPGELDSGWVGRELEAGHEK
ncbi:hypothetical protein Hte_010885 [Hypoxylon texense]